MVAEHQPAKLAAFEGHFETGTEGTPLYLFGWPDEESRTVKGGVAIPKMLSFLIYQDFNKPVPGLDQLEPDYGSPPVWLVVSKLSRDDRLWACCSLAARCLPVGVWWRGTLFQQAVVVVVLRVCRRSGLCRQRNWAGSRRKWDGSRGSSIQRGTRTGKLVGGLRTSDGVSEVVTSELVIGSIVMFGAIYALLFALWVFLLNRAIQQGPEPTRRTMLRSTGAES